MKKLGKVILDLTEIAEPISVDSIVNQLQTYQMLGANEPDLIRMWQHQFDWIVKHGPPASQYVFAPAGRTPAAVRELPYPYRSWETRPAVERHPRLIIGIPVEIANADD